MLQLAIQADVANNISAQMIDWPLELAGDVPTALHRWFQPGSNLCLDFHGDPVRAGAVVFSDGNHHMALAAVLHAFVGSHPDIQEIFYATTPPGALLPALRQPLYLGNLVLSRRPDIFISPASVIDILQKDGQLSTRDPFMRSQGNVILVRHGNPKNIRHITDLWRNDVRLVLSHPVTESASHQVYRQTLEAYGATFGLPSIIDVKGEQLMFSRGIHHREIPQIIADDGADASFLYYHLALRYQRAFPDLFDYVNTTGERQPPNVDAEQIISQYHLALLLGYGPWGTAIYDFLRGDTAGALYEHHGLCRCMA